MSNYRLEDVLNALRDTCQQGILVEESLLTGFSGKKILGALQRIAVKVVDEQNCYLEVGVFQGMTLLSVARVIPSGQAIGIDNFAYFDTKGTNYKIVTERQKTMSLTNVTIVNQDFEDALESLHKLLNGRKVSLFFVDGPHDYRSQLMALLLVKPFLSKQAVIVVDDCNYRHVRQANRDFLISHPEFKLIFESYTKGHPETLRGNDRADVEKGWWNGINVFYHDSGAEVKQVIYPEVLRDKTLYENEHIVHAFKYPAEIPKFLDLILSIESKRPVRAIHHLIKLFFRKATRKIVGKHSLRNTYSDDLPSEHLIT